VEFLSKDFYISGKIFVQILSVAFTWSC